MALIVHSAIWDRMENHVAAMGRNVSENEEAGMRAKP